MTDTQVVLIILVVYLIISILGSIKAFKRRGFKGFVYYWKGSANETKWGLQLIFAFYALLGMAMLSPSIATWSLNYVESHSISSFSEKVILLSNLAWFIAMLIVFFKIVLNKRPFFQLNEQERQWLKEDREKSKIRQWFKSHFPKLIKD